jgi:signal-transduction protein with cAMP-binding, CBS, and nucleotidyltransferase domain
MKIEELTMRPPVTTLPGTTIERAARLMAGQGVGALIVADDDGQPVGIVTDRDLVVRAVARGLPGDSRVDGVMSMNVIAIDAGADIRDAQRAFAEHAVRRLPIVDHGVVTGLLSLDDVLVALCGQLADATHGLTAQLLFPHGFDEPDLPAVVS